MSMDYAKPRLGNCPNCDRLEADLYRLAEWETAQALSLAAVYGYGYKWLNYSYEDKAWFAWLAAEEARIFGKAGR